MRPGAGGRHPGLTDRADAGHSARRRRRLARRLPQRLPDLPEPESSDPETERFLLFSAVAGALVELATSVPVCLVLDDLHWADAQSEGAATSSSSS
jgi:hypothetical protein